MTEREVTEKAVEEPSVARSRCWGLVHRRDCWVPTWRGWLALVFGVGLALVLIARSLDGFLSVTDSIPGGALVLEGWASDFVIDAAVNEYKTHSYEKLFVTGGPIEHGSPVFRYGTQAEFGGAILNKRGIGPDIAQVVPSPFVAQDRTFTEAVSVKKWLSEHGITLKSVNVITEGPHARRSRLLFEKAFGKGVEVGVMSIPSPNYDHKHWWRTSEGVRTMIGEVLAYGYARFLFRAPKE
jgi:uncharacterized SAM-binding protein YcdF (DUF218 family)